MIGETGKRTTNVLNCVMKVTRKGRAVIWRALTTTQNKPPLSDSQTSENNFQIAINAHNSRIITISYWRLRGHHHFFRFHPDEIHWNVFHLQKLRSYAQWMTARFQWALQYRRHVGQQQNKVVTLIFLYFCKWQKRFRDLGCVYYPSVIVRSC